MTTSAWVEPVTEEQFLDLVITRSSSVPVVVDFWAPWCGPCRTLGPLLEKLADEFSGKFILAKVNVDEEKNLAQQYRIQSIPTILGFWQGRAIREEIGVHHEAKLRDFISDLLPSPAWTQAKDAKDLAAAGHVNAAEELFRQSLEKSPNEPTALTGLAQLLSEKDDNPDGEYGSEALALLERIPFGTSEQKDSERLAAKIRTKTAGGDTEKLRLALDDDPSNLKIRLNLGLALASNKEYQEALENLLEVIRQDPQFSDESARKRMLDIFELLGPDHELTEHFRKKLARLLFR